MKRIVGIKASPGIAIGRAFILDRQARAIEKKEISARRVPKEIKRFLSALEKARTRMEKVRDGLGTDTAKELATILETHIMLLKDSVLEQDVIKIIKDQKVNAEWAMAEHIDKFRRLLSSVGDEYISGRTSDLEDVKNQIQMNLTGGIARSMSDIPEGAIVVARDLTPSETAEMVKKKVLGFVTEFGSKTSHVAIMARALETPAVVGAVSVLEYARRGKTIIVDGIVGDVIVSPTKKHIEEYTQKRQAYSYYVKELLSAADLPAETRDGFRVAIEANIESPDDISTAIRHGARGIGLYRTEFLFIHSQKIPTEEEHFRTYRTVAERIAPGSATVRTIDIGGEKLVDAVALPPQLNPALGLRAIRLSFSRPDMFKQQIRGILRASFYGNLKIMFPMISGVEELRRGREVVEECKRELVKEGVPINDEIEVGIMIEVPSAALTADVLARECDFFSIGTNDLIQYSIAIDRANEEVAYLYNPLHPAVLRSIKMIVEAAHANRVRVGVCGEMAGEPLYGLMLLGLGVDELSMNPISIPAVKKIVRNSRLCESLEIARKALEFKTSAETEAYIHRVMSKRYPQEIASLVL